MCCYKKSDFHSFTLTFLTLIHRCCCAVAGYILWAAAWEQEKLSISSAARRSAGETLFCSHAGRDIDSEPAEREKERPRHDRRPNDLRKKKSSRERDTLRWIFAECFGYCIIQAHTYDRVQWKRKREKKWTCSRQNMYLEKHVRMWQWISGLIRSAQSLKTQHQETSAPHDLWKGRTSSLGWWMWERNTKKFFFTSSTSWDALLLLCT